MVGAIPDSHGNLTVKALRLDITLPKKQIRAAHTYCSDGIFRTHKRFNRKQCHRMKYPDSASPLPPPSQLPSGILEVALRYSCRYSLWIAHSSFIPMLIFTFTGDCPCGVNITQCALFFNAFFVFCRKKQYRNPGLTLLCTFSAQQYKDRQEGAFRGLPILSFFRYTDGIECPGKGLCGL